MVHINIQQNNFSAGVINSDYLGRADLNLYANGVKNLQNMDILPSGAIRKRSGTELIARLAADITEREKAKYRLEKYSAKDGKNYLFLFRTAAIDIYHIENATISAPQSLRRVNQRVRTLSSRNVTTYGAYVKPTLPGRLPDAYPGTKPIFWNEDTIDDLKFAKGDDYFMICHPDNQPLLLTYDAQDLTFVLHSWQPDINGIGHYKLPYSRFGVDEKVRLKLTTQSSTEYRLYAEENLFSGNWVGAAINIADNGEKEVEVTQFISPRIVRCRIIGGTNLSVVGNYTNSWSQSVFSDAQGWPSCAGFHQGRLVFGATRSMPKSIWMSKTGNYHDFDLDDGSDDKAIDITLSASEAGAVRHFLSTKHLQIFTATSEWVISDEVITPSQVTARKKTSVGIHNRASLAPILVNGSSLFFDNRNNLHEYVYANLEDVYSVNNLNRLSDNSKGSPLAMSYDSQSRRLFCPWNNEENGNNQEGGDIRILALYQAEKITAWTQYQSVNCAFLDAVVIDDNIFTITKRSYYSRNRRKLFTYYLEKFSEKSKRDCQNTLRLDANNSSIQYMQAAQMLDGKIVIDKDDEEIGIYRVSQAIAEIGVGRSHYEYKFRTSFLTSLASRIHNNNKSVFTTGIPIAVNIESLPPIVIGQRPLNRYRLLQSVFHIGEAQSFSIDTGLGAKIIEVDELPISPSIVQSGEETEPFIRSIKLSGSGWSTNLNEPSWKIQFSNRSPFILYGVEMRLSVH